MQFHCIIIGTFFPGKSSSTRVKRESQPPCWLEDTSFLDSNNAGKKNSEGMRSSGYECLWTPYYTAVTTAAPATVFNRRSNCICNNGSSSYITWGQHSHNNNVKNNSTCSSIHNNSSRHNSTSSSSSSNRHNNNSTCSIGYRNYNSRPGLSAPGAIHLLII